MYGTTISEISGQLGGVFDYVLWSMGGAWADEDWNVTINRMRPAPRWSTCMS